MIEHTIKAQMGKLQSQYTKIPCWEIQKLATTLNDLLEVADLPIQKHVKMYEYIFLELEKLERNNGIERSKFDYVRHSEFPKY